MSLSVLAIANDFSAIGLGLTTTVFSAQETFVDGVQATRRQ